MVILNDKSQEKPKINYPCEWGFKIIGRDKNKLEKSVKDILSHKEYRCKVGNVSKNGKFYSFNAYCEVKNQEDRDNIFKAFKEHNDIKMVL
jgi:putative lipoic acid-binding regulatory protein